MYLISILRLAWTDKRASTEHRDASHIIRALVSIFVAGRFIDGLVPRQGELFLPRKDYF